MRKLDASDIFLWDRVTFHGKSSSTSSTQIIIKSGM